MASRKPAGPAVCRYCSTACTRDLTSEYLNRGRTEVYSEMLSETFNIKVYSDCIYEDLFSYLICLKCISRLRDAADFRKKVAECERVIEQYVQEIGGNSNKTADSKSDTLDKVEVNVDVKKKEKEFLVDIKEEVECITTYDDQATDSDVESIKYETVEKIDVDELFKKVKKEIVKSSAFDEQETDCEDDLIAVELEDITKEESDVEWSINEYRKRKSTKNKKKTRFKKAKIKEVSKTTDKSVVDDIKACDQTQGVTKHKARSRKMLQTKTQSKKVKGRDSLKAARQSASMSNDETDNELSMEGPDPAMMNAKLIVKFATAYPFRAIKNEVIGCAYCKEMFQNQPEQFRQHIQAAHTHLDKASCIPGSRYARLPKVDVSDLSCRECPQKFQTLKETATHLKEQHAIPIDLNESLGLVPIKLGSKFECVVCGSEFSGLQVLSRHTGFHFALNICHICGKKVQSRKCSCSIACDSCKQTFETLEARRRHYKTSKKCLPYKCKECGENFNSVEVRQRHYVESHGRPEAIFQCPKCDLTFPYRSRMTQHYNTTHSDSYKCNYCQERFCNNVALGNHIGRVHTLERAFRCRFCDSSYYTKGQLNIHMRTHDDSLKYHCQLCGQMFVRRYRLRDHIVKCHPGVKAEDIILY